jgi:hypothetical protein
MAKSVLHIVMPLACILAADTAAAQSASYFRHDHGVATSDAQPLPESLDDEHLVWKTPLPSGASTPRPHRPRGPRAVHVLPGPADGGGEMERVDPG